MPDAATMSVFVLATLALLVVPGPAVLFIVARGIDQGRSAALTSAAGVGVGSLVHLTAAVLGLSVLLASSAVAFSAVKYLGAAYLVYLGIRTLLTKPERTVAIDRCPKPLRRLFAEGVIVQALNPKIALFFLAFLPQFLDPSRGPVALQTLALGAILVGMGMCTDSAYGLVAGSLGGMLRESRAFASAQRWVAGSVFIGLGVSAAVTGTPQE